MKWVVVFALAGLAAVVGVVVAVVAVVLALVLVFFDVDIEKKLVQKMPVLMKRGFEDFLNRRSKTALLERIAITAENN